MSAGHESRPIVIKRVRKPARHGSHGAWKIAYADFMTAMMAFFLVMWLLGGLSDQQMDEVSEYFRTPLAAAMAGGDKSNASDSAIPGGGDDPMHEEGEVALSRAAYSPDRSDGASDRAALEALAAALAAEIENNPELAGMASQLDIAMVADGLRVRIHDGRAQPMFALGSAALLPSARRLLVALAPTLDGLDNRITLTGHTDDRRYGSRADYSNWELSADRANSARRTLVAAGLDASKPIRVIAAAATQRVGDVDANAPENRRITLMVLNETARERLESPDPPAEAAPIETQRLAQRSAPGDTSTALWPGGMPRPGAMLAADSPRAALPRLFETDFLELR